MEGKWHTKAAVLPKEALAATPTTFWFPRDALAMEVYIFMARMRKDKRLDCNIFSGP
jgi:hypothetical protein